MKAWTLLVLSTLTIATPVLGANCTADETETMTQLYANATTSEACADLASNAAATTLDYCQDSDCIAVLEDMVGQVPDCMDDDGVNKREGLEAILVYCEDATATLEASASASASGSVESQASDTGASAAGSSSSGASRIGFTALALLVPAVVAAFAS